MACSGAGTLQGDKGLGGRHCLWSMACPPKALFARSVPVPVMAWRIYLHPIWQLFLSLIAISQRKNKSLQLTSALYYLFIVLSNTMKHNSTYFYVWSTDWKMLQNCVCRTGHSSTECPPRPGVKNCQTISNIWGNCPPCNTNSNLNHVITVEPRYKEVGYNKTLS